MVGSCLRGFTVFTSHQEDYFLMKFLTRNIRLLYEEGELDNAIQEMKNMNLEMLRILKEDGQKLEKL